MKELLGRGRSSRLWVRFGRYSIGSGIALACSEATFVLCYGTADLGPTASSVAAFVAGALPNYVFNRYWAWGRRGRLHLGREVVLYGAIILGALLVSIIATGWAERVAGDVTSGDWARTVVVSLAYLGTQGVLFLAKFALFQRFIFTDSAASGSAAQSSG